MSEIITLQNGLYEYKIPSPPSREEDILFITHKKKDQYWRLPPKPDFRRMNIREKIKFVDQERDRVDNGVFMMNNGELTYLNGLHYRHMVHMTFDGQKAFYLDNQRKDFYFRQLSWEHPKCKGRVIAKGRRVGASMEELTESTDRLTADFYRHVGFISIEERKTKKSLFDPFVDSFVKMDKYMRPIYYKPNSKKPKQSLKLSSEDISEDSEFGSEIDTLELNGWLLPVPTSVSAFDAYKMHYVTADEIWKWKDVSPREFLETQLPCFDDGGKKIGIISLLSTLGDTEDVKRAIEDGIYIYKNSDPKDLMEDGFTKTGLWKWFISAIYAEREMRDVYGKINEDEATAKIMLERSKHEEGSLKWIQAVRRKPLTEQEAMATASGSTTFDNIRIEERITIITKAPIREKPYVTGELHEDSTTGKVHFEPSKNGFWQIAIHPKKNSKGDDFSNRWYMDANEVMRLNKSPEGAIGYDPVRYGDKQTVSSNLSKAAIIAKYKFDYFGNKDKYGKSCAGQYAGLYVNRDEDPDAPHHEFLKAIKYWGFPGMYERQVEAVLKHFKDNKALEFLMKYRGKYGIWTDNQQKVIKKGIDRFQGIIKRPKHGTDDIDRLKDIPFDLLLQDAKDLDPANTRKSDIFMANTMLMHAEEQIIYTDEIDELLDDSVKDLSLYTLFKK